MGTILGLLLLMPPQTAPMVPGSEGRGALLGSVPQGTASAEELPLSLSDAIQRGLAHNLGALLAAQGVRAAEGDRWEKLSDLLPHLSAHLAATRQKINLEAFGFSGFPGLPVIVGPFNVFDARAVVSQSVLDLEALNKVRAGDERLAAARYAYQDTRDLVALVCGNLYLQVLAEEARIKAAEAQVDTARALHELAADRKSAGLAPAVDALRAEVELKAREQQLIVAQNRHARARLSLARAIGLPLGQSFRLTDRVAYAPPPPMTLDEALQRAYASRCDWKSAQAEVRAAEDARKAARAEALPSVEVNADYGAIGAKLDDARATYSYGATLRVPLFQGGKVKGKTISADAVLEGRRSLLEDLRSRIDFDVRTALLDLGAAGERVEVARKALDLAREQLTQAKDRFEAGVANNVDVVQAQQALALATESYISSVYDHNVAKAAMARALGVAEAMYEEFVRGN
jgi:outer membrane protein TolC